MEALAFTRRGAIQASEVVALAWMWGEALVRRRQPRRHRGNRPDRTWRSRRVGWAAGDFSGDVKVAGNVTLGMNSQLFATGGEENLRMIRGAVDPDGNIIPGSGFMAQQGLPGDDTIHFDTPFSAAPVVTISAHVGYARCHV